MADENETAVTLADEPVNLDAPEVETKEETTQAEGEEGEPKKAGEETAGEEPPKKPSGSARAKIRESRLLSELQARERELDELRSKVPAAKIAGEEEAKAPREEDFNGDYFAWQRALTAFDVKSAIAPIAKHLETREQSERSKQQTEIARERAIAHGERVEDAREVIADFDPVMKGMDGVQVRQDVIDEIMSSDKSALLAYHLAKNPDKLQALNGLSGRELAREMGRLEGSIRMPAAKKQTTALPPLQPLKGGASGSFDPTSASMDEYVAKRNAGWKG